ncbi:probable G-protein coupled receptor Mth-like 7 isoform X2 [Drosophila gunungcola]|uniref:probable G-protein coupled receptor Mth-like 7 isoform X2 n=1 Tax=Drosophila gunungcola TaxID=103775 RepID=UPI0022DED4F3|nr:probable G-protein coupled receptor Mth-like 7 isoform X2 [Drosophila gunungcola]
MLWKVIGDLITMTCAGLTIAVYLYVEKLRNVLGKCIVSNLCCLLIISLDRIADNMVKFIDMPPILDNVVVDFAFAYYLWFSIISYHLWKLLTSLSCAENPNQFRIYSIFVWVTTSIYVSALYIMRRYLNISSETASLMICLPKCVAYGFNVVMFILTAHYMIKVKRELNRYKVQEETTVTCLDIDSQTYLQFVRISALMGVSYIIFAIFYYIRQSYFNERPFWVVICFDRFYGAFIFLMLIPRRSTLSLLVDSFAAQA